MFDLFAKPPISSIFYGLDLLSSGVVVTKLSEIGVVTKLSEIGDAGEVPRAS